MNKVFLMSSTFGIFKRTLCIMHRVKKEVTNCLGVYSFYTILGGGTANVVIEITILKVSLMTDGWTLRKSNWKYCRVALFRLESKC